MSLYARCFFIGLACWVAVSCQLAAAEGLGGVWDLAVKDPVVLEGPKQRLQEDLASARERLGDDFSGAVIDYSQRNGSLAYWLGAVLMGDGEERSDLLLATSVFQSGMLRWDKVAGQEYNVYRSAVLLSICHERIGASLAAESVCRKVGQMLGEAPVLAGSFPVLTEEDRATYEAIEGRLE